MATVLCDKTPDSLFNIVFFIVLFSIILQGTLIPPVARALNDRGYDFVTLGNHDFNQGRATLADYLEELDAR